MLSLRLSFLSLFVLTSLSKAAQSPVELPKPDRGGVTPYMAGPFDYGVMGPPATHEIVAKADAAVASTMPEGPFAASWDSLKKNYNTPSWFEDAKFGIFMHWGIYSVSAHHNEWYVKHMYAGGADTAWHISHFGELTKVGYKDLIPQFTASKWNPAAWAKLFKSAGAKFVIPTAQHSDNFANWDSRLTNFNSMRMGPKRDLVGELSIAVRSAGLKFGVSNHGMENFTFVNPSQEINELLKTKHLDLYDPAWIDFYHVADRSDQAMTRFLTDWVDRNIELIDKYQPDLIYLDNGVNLRVLDPLKLHVAAYYYNRAKQWGKEVSMSTKFNAYAPSNDDTKQIGSIVDFEKIGKRSPAGIRKGPWMVDDPLCGNSWGYVEGMSIASAKTILGRLIDTVSKGGVYLLNISPKADGTIPENQQATLLGVGSWLKINGEAIYATRPWSINTESDKDNSTVHYYYTTKGNCLYVIASAWPGDKAVLTYLGNKITPNTSSLRIELLGANHVLNYTCDSEGLKINLPLKNTVPEEIFYTFKLSGLKTIP